MTHITSGLVNRKYKAAALAPVAANVMMPIRGISCKRMFSRTLLFTHFTSSSSYSKSLNNVINEQKKLTSFFFLNIWKNPAISYIQNIKTFEKQEFYFHSAGLEFRSRG